MERINWVLHDQRMSTSVFDSQVTNAARYREVLNLLETSEFYNSSAVKVSPDFILDHWEVLALVKTELRHRIELSEDAAKKYLQHAIDLAQTASKPDAPNIKITPKGEQELQAQAVAKKPGAKARKKPAKKSAARSPARRKPAKARAAKKPARKSSTARWRAARKAAVKKLTGKRAAKR